MQLIYCAICLIISCAYSCYHRSYTGIAAKIKVRSLRLKRFDKRLRRSTRVIAVSLAFIMVFSMFGANISSIVDLLVAYANVVRVGNDLYYSASLDLYDYYTDNEIVNGLGNDDNANLGVNANTYFNSTIHNLSTPSVSFADSSLKEGAGYCLPL